MNQTNIYVNDNVETDFENMFNDISTLEEILNNVMLEMNKLDEKVWKSEEKEQLNQTFIPFLKKYCDKYPSFLRNNVEIVKNSGIQQYRDLENKIQDVV